MESLVLSPPPKPKLNTTPNCSFSLPQECDLKWSVWNFLVSGNEVILPERPLPSPKERLGNLLFSLACPLLSTKIFPFQQLFYSLGGMLPKS